ncbi:MAG: tetratricopeptide repeat protein [Bacteroidota bacterium]
MKGILTSLFVVTAFVALAQKPAEQFKLANEALAAEKPELAVQAFEALLEQGYQSENLLFNLGNACLATDQLGKAILYYEKALLLDPDDKDIQHNLKIAQTQRVDDIQALPPFFLIQWWQGLRDSLSANMWSVFCLLFLFAMSGGVWVWLHGQDRSLRKRGFLSASGFATMAFIVFLLAWSRSHSEFRSDNGVILAEQIELYVSYDLNSKVLLTLHEGTKVELLERIGEQCQSEGDDCWFKVSLANGEVGWLPFESLKRI